MAAALVDGDKIEIRGFGSFHVRRRRPRRGRNPRSGTKVDVPAKRVPHFKPGKEIRAALNGGSRTVFRTHSHASPSGAVVSRRAPGHAAAFTPPLPADPAAIMSPRRPARSASAR
jgi:hypothetical protein